jgi:hypothetical protein
MFSSSFYSLPEQQTLSTTTLNTNFDPSSITESLKQHEAFTYVTSPAKLRLFGQYHIFVVWNYWYIWEKLDKALQSFGKPSKNSTLSLYLRQHTIEVNNDIRNSFLHSMQKLQTNFTAPQYKFWREIETDFNSLQMLVSWLHQSKRPCPPLSRLNFPAHLNNFVRYTLESTVDLLPHELAISLFTSNQSMGWSRARSMVSFNRANPSLMRRETSSLRLVDNYNTDPYINILAALCLDDKDAWQEAIFSAHRAVKFHLKLWDGVEKELKYYDIFNSVSQAETEQSIE